MNLKFTLKSFLTMVALGFSFGSQAQTVDLQAFTDSTFTSYCPTPAVVQFDAWGQTTGYISGTDSVEVHINFGDGSDTTFMSPIYGTTQQWFSFYPQHTYNLAGSYMTQAIVTGPGGVSDSITHGPILISSACATIEGDLYFDNNSNCLFDAGDDTVKYTTVYVLDAGTGDTIQQAWTGSGGHYSTTVPSGMNLEVIAHNNAGVSTVCPVSGSYAFNLAPSAVAQYDFALECTSTGFDLHVHAYGAGFVPGQEHYMHIGAGNYACLPQAGTITLTLDPLVSYVSNSSGAAPTSVAGNVITWNTPSLSNGVYYTWWWNQFYSGFKITTDTTAVVGDTVCHSISITPTSGDLDVSNNTYSYCSPVLASYDPNMKEVSPKGIGLSGDVDPNTTFTYTIHFQNTGNYPAQNVYVMDTISQNLDFSTLEILGSSHNMNVLDLGNGKLKFQFNNIWLADSVSNEPESHGHVVYRIKAKSSLNIGSQIENTAHIFFDYNDPIVTNTTLNTIAVLSSIQEINDIKVNIYPNPTATILNLDFDQAIDGSISVRDMMGRVVMTVPANGTKISFNASNLSQGFYNLDFNGKPLGKFVVNK